MGLIHHDDEHPAVLEAQEATRLPRWFWLAAVLVCIAVTLPACGGGDGGDDAAAPAWQACTDTGWVSMDPTASVSIGSRQALPASADGRTPGQAAGQLMLRLPAGAQASATASATLHPTAGAAITGQPSSASATAGADGVAVLALAAVLPTGTAARAPAELALQVQATGVGGAISAWRLAWCAQGVAP